MRTGILVAALALVMAAGASRATVVTEPSPLPVTVAQKPGQWESHTSITAFVGDAHLLGQVSTKARLQLPLVTRTVDQEETTETVVRACWSEAKAAVIQLPDPEAVLEALHRQFADLPCTEPEHAANVAILQCDFGGGITATRSLTVNVNTPFGYEIADEMLLKRTDTPDGLVALHWRIATKSTWIGPTCDGK